MDRTSQAEETVRRYSDMVYRLAFARTGNTADAEDVYQEVFLRYLRSDPQFTSEEHRKAWLLRVTVNCAGDLHRAVQRRRTVPLEEGAWVPGPEPDGILEAVLTLPEVYRVPIHLFYYEELSVAEIAALLGRSEGAVKTRLSRARDLLRAQLKGENEHA